MRDDLTRYINRSVSPEDAGQAEAVRTGLIRDAVRPQVAREKGGVRGLADRPHLTQLVQEVWIKLERSQAWESRGHFLAAASRAARQVLVDEARKRSRRIRTTPLDPARAGRGLDQDPTLPATVHDLLATLESTDPVPARIAGFRLFGGLPVQVIAELEGISVRQTHRHWQFARAWLADRIHSGSEA